MQKIEAENKHKFSLGMFLVALGIVYGDIGTSPMYVMKSIVEGNGGITNVDQDFIVGSLSLVIWTITLLTTVKHVLIALRADNHGEGGIFALYSLIRNCGKWLIIPTMIGGCTMLADGVLTPAVTVTTAVEGLRSIDAVNDFLGSGQHLVVVITLAIISLLFIIQRSGTSSIGKMFGPVMMVWFLFLGVTGIWLTLGDLSILKALNPVYALQVLFSPHNKAGFLILGSVFLCTTGAEALYTDMGHVGRSNIFISWPFVKICLILNYMGQCVWIIQNQNNPIIQVMEDLNPFYMMLPEAMRPLAILLSALAAIIASQALISGSYTLVREASSLDLMPHLNVQYPSDTKGQIYIPYVNNILWFFCVLVVLYFQSGSRMENAYGLAITISMLMMTVLFCVYIGVLHKHPVAAAVFGVIFFALEGVFFISSLGKFVVGGYVAIIISLMVLFIMIAWYRGTEIEQEQNIFLNMREHLDSIKKLQNDESIPLCSNNVVYLVKGDETEVIDRDILYSILDKDPKRADAYWFISVNTTNDPYQKQYEVETFGTDGSFKFCMIRKTMPQEGDIDEVDDLLIRAKYVIRRICGNPFQWFGLENSNMIIEYVPLFLLPRQKEDRLERL